MTTNGSPKGARVRPEISAVENEFTVQGNFGLGLAELGKAIGMSLVSTINLRVVLMTAVLISGLLPVARASALPSQDSQQGTPQAPAARVPSPLLKVGHAESAPIATYDDGQLTIVAENVPLSEVMNALHTIMGTEIDIPSSASDERIWARLGPGPARKVLSDLLSNTDLDYVIQGSSKDAAGIQSVILTVRTEATPGKPGAPPETAQRIGDHRPRGAIKSGAGEEWGQQDVAVPQEPAAAVEPTPHPTSVTPASAPTPPMEPQSATAGERAPVDNSIIHPAPPASLTADQMAQQPSNMYQQRKQMQQTQSGSTPN